MKDEERRLLLAMRRVDGVAPKGREVVAALGIDPKRAAHLFGRWKGRGWYGYGASPMAGWLEERGEAVAGRMKQ
jgi:hypothetical protein